jgi:hypothetical protein
MAQTDLTGLLTGITQAPIDPMQGASIRDREIALQQQALGGFRRGVGALTGGRVDARSTAEKAQDALAKLDINNPDDQDKILQIVSRVNPERAAVLKAQFAQQGRVRDEESAGLAKEQAQRQKFASYLDKTYPDKGYGALALQGLITPANMKNFIKEADSGKTSTETISEGGKNKLVVLDGGGNIVKRYDAEITGTSNPNAPKYFTEDLVRDGKKIKVMFKREGDVVSEVSTIGPTELPSIADLEEIEVTKDDGQTYVQFLDLTKPEGERVAHEQKINENRVTTEGIDPLTGLKIKYTTLPDGTGRIPFGTVELPKYDIQVQADGTYNVFNETLGRMEQEGVATQASARQLIAKKQKTQETLNDIERQIGFVNEAKTLTESYQPTDAVIFHPLMKYVPGSDAKYLEKLTETLQSRIARDTLMELREGSAVGATGLGALNLKELELLQNALGNLDPTVGDARFRKQLDLVKKHYQGFRASLLGRPTEIDWTNPAYREFTRTIPDAQGNPKTYYTLSDETGAPLVGSDGKPMWYLANIPVKKD